MNVNDVMCEEVACCQSGQSLELVAGLMLDSDCGSIPVTDDDGKAIGMITDRDITIAAAARHKALWELQASDLCNNSNIYTCCETDDIRTALNTMIAERVRRLPVLDGEGCVTGMLSIDDIVAYAERGIRGAGSPDLSFDDAISALKVLCKHH